jgi:ABC-type Fe2+-enterobactin transport system substrate-binding protein
MPPILSPARFKANWFDLLIQLWAYEEALEAANARIADLEAQFKQAPDAPDLPGDNVTVFQQPVESEAADGA